MEPDGIAAPRLPQVRLTAFRISGKGDRIAHAPNEGRPAPMTRIAEPSRVSLAGIGLAIAGHGAAYVQFTEALRGMAVSEHWYAQGVFLLSLSAALSLAGHLLRASGPRLILLVAVRFAVFIVFAYPLGSATAPRASLLCVLAFDIMILGAPPVDMILTALVLAGGSILPQGAIAWGSRVHELGASEALAASFGPAVVAAAGAAYKRYKAIATERKRMLDLVQRTNLELIDTNLVLQEKVIDQEGTIIELERNRISRELHDTIGYTLMNILVLQKAAAALIRRKPAEAEEFMAKTVSQAEQGLRETREAIRMLRGDAAKPLGVVEAVSRLARAFENTHIRIAANLNNSARSYGPSADDALRRFVQEAITNAIKHGNADEIAIGFWRGESGLSVSVRDNGSGVEDIGGIQEGLGMKGMRERLGALGGRIAAENLVDGFRITAFVPTGCLEEGA
jgi:signal transduction histidine kinase